MNMTTVLPPSGLVEDHTGTFAGVGSIIPQPAAVVETPKAAEPSHNSGCYWAAAAFLAGRNALFAPDR